VTWQSDSVREMGDSAFRKQMESAVHTATNDPCTRGVRGEDVLSQTCMKGEPLIRLKMAQIEVKRGGFFHRQSSSSDELNASEPNSQANNSKNAELWTVALMTMWVLAHFW
jgi:hypothetical protein